MAFNYRSLPCTCALIAFTLALLAGCATNTITGRSQLVLVSERQAIKGSASAYSSMMGQFSKKGKIVRASPRVERVREITNRLVAEAVRFRPASAKWKWQVEVIDEPKTVNAFCMAGGKMGIYTGMWEKLHATDDEIANVMGHEIGHALASHTREKMSVAMSASVGAAILAAIVSSRSDSSSYEATNDAFQTAAGLAITLPNSREAEAEADQIGIELAARAGFDPRAAVTLWQKMAKEGGSPPEFLSTHPSPVNRLNRLSELAVKVEPLYRDALNRTPGDIPQFIAVGNERRVGGISREEYARRLAAEPQTMTFVADDFEKFKRGDLALQCGYECALRYNSERSTWKRLHAQKQWRDLVVSVITVGYENDLSYFLLGEAAQGLQLREAAKNYYSRALAAQKAGKTCSGAIDTCIDIDVLHRAQAALNGM